MVLSVENFAPPYLFNLEVVSFDIARVDGGLVGENASVIYQREIAAGDYEIGASQSLNGRSVLYFTREHIIRLDFSLADKSVAASVQAQVGGTNVSSLDWDVYEADTDEWNVDYSSSDSGSGEWIVGAIWAGEGGLDAESWQGIVEHRSYTRSSSLVGENVRSSSSGSGRWWAGSATSSESATLTFPWGVYTLVDVSAEWAGESSDPGYTRLWGDDYVENTVITRTVDRRVYALVGRALLAVSIGDVYEVREGGALAKTGPTGLPVNSTFATASMAPQYSFSTPTPVSVHQSVSSPVAPIAMPLQTRGVLHTGVYGAAAAMGEAAFMSIWDEAGGYMNYMTDNPGLTGVFPAEVSLDGAFYPIVPF